MNETRFHHVTHEGTVVILPTVAAALDAAKAGGYVWLDYCQPSREDLAPLTALLGVHPLAIDDCLDDNAQA